MKSFWTDSSAKSPCTARHRSEERSPIYSSQSIVLMANQITFRVSAGEETRVLRQALRWAHTCRSGAESKAESMSKS